MQTDKNYIVDNDVLNYVNLSPVRQISILIRAQLFNSVFM